MPLCYCKWVNCPFKTKSFLELVIGWSKVHTSMLKILTLQQLFYPRINFSYPICLWSLVVYVVWITLIAIRVSIWDYVRLTWELIHYTTIRVSIRDFAKFCPSNFFTLCISIWDFTKELEFAVTNIFFRTWCWIPKIWGGLFPLPRNDASSSVSGMKVSRISIPST